MAKGDFQVGYQSEIGKDTAAGSGEIKKPGPNLENFARLKAAADARKLGPVEKAAIVSQDADAYADKREELGLPPEAGSVNAPEQSKQQRQDQFLQDAVDQMPPAQRQKYERQVSDFSHGKGSDPDAAILAQFEQSEGVRERTKAPTESGNVRVVKETGVLTLPKTEGGRHDISAASAESGMVEVSPQVTAAELQKAAASVSKPSWKNGFGLLG